MEKHEFCFCCGEGLQANVIQQPVLCVDCRISDDSEE